MAFRTWAGIGILFALAITIFRQYFIWIILLFIIILLIRWIADIFWWGRDNDRW